MKTTTSDTYISVMLKWVLDPNYHYRPWLEQNVGRQGYEWQWYTMDGDKIRILFTKDKEEWAILARLMWG